MRLKDLAPNSRNPRKITDQKLAMLKKSLDEFGDLSGIVWNKRSGKLVGGHQRGKVLPQDADIVILQKYETPTRTGTIEEGFVLMSGEKMQFRCVDWEEQKEQAAMIAANRHGGEWDMPMLSEIILELDSSNYELDLIGYDALEVETMMTTHVSAHERVLPGDPHAEWEGMPEFDQKDKSSFRHVIVHFENQEAVKEFFLAIKQNNTESRSIWYPPQEHMKTKDKIY